MTQCLMKKRKEAYKWLCRYLEMRFNFSRVTPRHVARVLSKAEHRIKELWGKQYDAVKLKSNPDEAFNDVIARVYRIIIEKDIRDILVLSPFIYKRYAEKFADFVRMLKEKLGNISVVVVTRSPEYVVNPHEHVESIEILRRAGIKVCISKNSRFHAKVIVLGTKYVIAGSVNPLAPSHEEVVIRTSLVKLLENPLSAISIIRVFRDTLCTANN